LKAIEAALNAGPNGDERLAMSGVSMHDKKKELNEAFVDACELEFPDVPADFLLPVLLTTDLLSLLISDYAALRNFWESMHAVCPSPLPWRQTRIVDCENMTARYFLVLGSFRKL
jgi:hypothetical protein